MQKENDRMLKALAINGKMAVYDLARPAFGVLLPFAVVISVKFAPKIIFPRFTYSHPICKPQAQFKFQLLKIYLKSP